MLALRNRDAPAFVRELSRQRERCLPGANDYNIVVIHFKPGSRGTARSRFDCTGLLYSLPCSIFSILECHRPPAAALKTR